MIKSGTRMSQKIMKDTNVFVSMAWLSGICLSNIKKLG